MCGTSGECERRSLTDLTKVVHSTAGGQSDSDSLNVSTNYRRPAVALMWDNKLFLIAVTYGENVHSTTIHGRPNTYKYNAITLREASFGFDFSSEFRKIQMNIKKGNLNDYVIYYQDVFQYDPFAYLLTNQKKYVGNDTYVSKIVQLCNYDPTLRTYVDMELTCEKDGVTYNLVQTSTVGKINGADHLMASFTRGSDPEKVMGESVICKISLDSLNAQLTDTAIQYINTYPFNQTDRYLETIPDSIFGSDVSIM